jgi:phage-related protein
MSDFTYNVSAATQLRRQPRVLVAPYGDGYEQRVQDGINANPQSWNVVFTRGDTDVAAIEAFFELKAGVTAFTWTPPGKSEIKVVCRSWSRGFSGVNNNTLNATFDQVFE